MWPEYLEVPRFMKSRLLSKYMLYITKNVICSVAVITSVKHSRISSIDWDFSRKLMVLNFLLAVFICLLSTLKQFKLPNCTKIALLLISSEDKRALSITVTTITLFTTIQHDQRSASCCIVVKHSSPSLLSLPALPTSWRKTIHLKEWKKKETGMHAAH